MMINSGMYKSIQSHSEYPEHKEEHTEHKEEHPEHKEEHKEEHIVHQDVSRETTNISAESIVDIAKMISSMIETTNPAWDIKCIQEKIYDLDKRISINEALLKHLLK